MRITSIGVELYRSWRKSHQYSLQYSRRTRNFPDVLYSLYGSVYKKNASTSSSFFPKRIRIKLSKEDIQRLILSADLIQVSDDLKPTFSAEKKEYRIHMRMSFWTRFLI